MSRHAAAAGRLACAVVLCLTASARAAPPGRPAAVVTLKDGQVIKGYVGQPSETIIDPISQTPITVHKGIFVVNDYCRRFFFSHAFVDKAEPRPFDYGKLVNWKIDFNFIEGKSLPPIRAVLDVGDWNEKWDRTYSFQSPERPVKLAQHLAILTPHYFRVDAYSRDPVTRAENVYPWTSYYRTRELSPERVAGLLSRHKDLNDAPGLTPEQRADRRFQIFNFLVQVGWMTAAERELADIKRDFPDQKEKVETAAEGIKKLVALDRWDAITRARDSGRHETAQKLLAAFPAEGADDQVLGDVRALKVRYEKAGDALKRAKALLAEMPARVPAGEDPRLFTEAAAAITAELTLDHFLKKADNDEGRLDRFLTQAEQSERFAKQDKPHLGPGELMSLAVTGWLLGSASAELKPETARRAWRARQLVLEYQKTADPGARSALLKAYDSKSGLTVAEMAQLISALPPADPPETAPIASVVMKAGNGKGASYLLKLPPEYHAGRPYPVLIALHQAGESLKDVLDRWGDEAANHGYILAAPEWGNGVGGFYAYTAAEHATVLESLRDLRQHFNVDSDRVFLTGYGEGGNMAFDVGLAHPDLFAGVIPINGQPRYHARNYWTNARDLPFYIVWGEYMGGPLGKDKKSNGNLVNYNLFKDDWIPGGYPALGVQYQGRGLEWFPAELTDIFEWAARKRRRSPDRIGQVSGNFAPLGEEFRSLRAGDNHFYWLSVSDFSPRCLTEALAWDSRATPARLAASIAKGNKIGVYTQGVGRVSVWLARGMIDFDKELTVSVNYKVRWNNEKVKPSLATLLEDYYDRGDRQRLYVARLDLKP